MNFPRVTEPRVWVRLLAVGLLMVVPLAFDRGFAEQFSYVKIFLTKLLVILGVGAWALAFLAGKIRRPASLRLAAPLALFTLAVLVSSLNSPVPAFTLREAEYFLCGPLWTLLLISWGEGETTVRSVAVLVTLAAGVVASIAVVQWLGFDPLLFGKYRVDWGAMAARMRLYSTFGNPNFVAGYLIGAIFLALALGALSRKLRARIMWYGCAAMMLAAILGAGSYGAWAGLVAGGIVTALVWKSRGREAPAAAAARREKVGLARARGVLFPGIFWPGATLLGQVMGALLGRLEGRLFLWRSSWPMFLEHPFLGGGCGSFQLRFLDLQASFLAAHREMVRYWSNIHQLHNDLLQLLLETGLVGFGAFAWVLWSFARETRRALGVPSERLWLGAGAGGVTAILVDSLFNFQFYVPPTFLLLFTLIAFPALLGDRPDAKSKMPLPSPPAEVSESFRLSPGVRIPKALPGWLQFRALRLLGGLAVLVACGALLVQFTRRAAAEREYAQALRLEHEDELERAEQSYRAGLRFDPLNGRLHYGLARVLYLRGKFPTALAEAQLAERTYRDSHLEVLKGRVQDQMGLAAPALETYRHALALDPTLKTVQGDIERLSSR